MVRIDVVLAEDEIEGAIDEANVLAEFAAHDVPRRSARIGREHDQPEVLRSKAIVLDDAARPTARSVQHDDERRRMIGTIGARDKQHTVSQWSAAAEVQRKCSRLTGMRGISRS